MSFWPRTSSSPRLSQEHHLWMVGDLQGGRPTIDIEGNNNNNRLFNAAAVVFFIFGGTSLCWTPLPYKERRLVDGSVSSHGFIIEHLRVGV